MPDEDMGENIGIGLKVAILAGLIGIFIIPWVFEIAVPEMMPMPVAPLPTFFSSSEDTPSITVAAYDSSATSKSIADYVCDGIQDQNEINTAFNALPQGGEVILSEGTFKLDAAVYPKTGITLRGQGDTKTFLKFTNDGQILVDKEFITLEKFHMSGSAHTSRLAWMGVMTIRAGHCTVRDITGTSDDTIYAVFMVLSDKRSGYNKIIEDIEFTNCKAIDPGAFGFLHNSWYDEYNLIRNVRYTYCQAINCGRYERISPWVTGFDFAEGNDIDNLRVTGCIAEGNWESGFHFEWGPITTDAILTDCIAKNNGQKPFPSIEKQEFLSGFHIGKGQVTLVNCHSEGNSMAGFLVDDATGVKMYGCSDKNTAIGRSDFSVYKPASFYIINSYPGNPLVMENCSSTGSNGRGLYLGPKKYFTEARVKNFVVTDAAGVDGTAIQLNNIRPGSVFEIHASGTQASTLISVNGAQNANFTGSIVSDAARPFVVDGTGTRNVIIHDFETISNTLTSKSTGITVSKNVPAGAVQIVNCYVTSPTSVLGFLSYIIG